MSLAELSEGLKREAQEPPKTYGDYTKNSLQEMLTQTVDFLEWYAEHLEEKEPEATSSVGNVRACLDELPHEIDDILGEAA